MKDALLAAVRAALDAISLDVTGDIKTRPTDGSEPRLLGTFRFVTPDRRVKPNLTRGPDAR